MITSTSRSKNLLGGIYETERSDIDKILDRAFAGYEVSVSEAIALFQSSGKQADRVFAVADRLRQGTNGDIVSFIVNRNINFTNICYMGCKFCGFAKRLEDDDAQFLSLEEVVRRSREAMSRGATEVCIQGGLHPKMKGTQYREIIKAIKTELPNIHIHAFSPFEIWYGASKTKLSFKDFLSDLKDCGLGSMPGTAAEILDINIRKVLSLNKLSAERWIEIIKTAHSLNIPTTATIMYGHIDRPVHWANHIALLREIQKETGGFTELVPLSFVHTNSPLYIENPNTVRPGPTLDEIKKMHAVSRIMLNGYIDNIQVSWTKLGAQTAQEMLSIGVNDLGGTLMNESISRAAGSGHGQEITPKEFSKIIRDADKIPALRNTLYEVLEIYDKNDPEEYVPLVDRKGANPLTFLRTRADLQKDEQPKS